MLNHASHRHHPWLQAVFPGLLRAGFLSSLLLFLIAIPAQASQPLYPPGDQKIRDQKVRPIILVHGWRGPEGDLLADDQFKFMSEWLAKDGFRIYWVTGVRSTQTMRQNAERIQQVVHQAMAETQSQDIWMIGHSMGGLNLRAYLESDLYEADRANGLRVGAFVTLGSPHLGVTLWLPFLFLVGDPIHEPSTWELTPFHMAWFNAIHPPRPEIPYYLLAGDASAQLPILGLLGPNDTLVTVASAHGLPLSQGYASHLILTDDIHGWNGLTQLFNLRTYLLPDNTYRSHILPALQNPDLPTGAGSVSAAWDWQPKPVASNMTILAQGELSWKQAGSAVFRVPASTSTLLISGFSTDNVSSGLSGSLEAPDGSSFSLGQATRLSDNDGLNVQAIPVEVPGVYRLNLKGTGKYVVTGLNSDDLTLEVSPVRPWVHSGEPLTITASLQRGTRPQRGASANMDLIWEDGQKESTGLYDNGSHGDSQAGDGIYTIALNTGTHTGYAGLQVRASGWEGWSYYRRDSASVASVAPLWARLGQIPRPETCTAGICAEIPINVQQAGQYVVSAALVGSDGKTAGREIAYSTLTPGSQTITLRFSGNKEGAYRLATVRLSASGETRPGHLEALLPLDEKNY
ncbi:MAG: hypothetical protein HY326_13950 [Chloroflexi bacterium]|nr:hypothetical protein [Chloroflexota bacterium]